MEQAGERRSERCRLAGQQRALAAGLAPAEHELGQQQAAAQLGDGGRDGKGRILDARITERDLVIVEVADRA